MELINATDLLAEHCMGMDTSGRERIVVVLKGTFAISAGDGEPTLAEEQVAPVLADEFIGEPGRSSTLYEYDFAPFKPRCDVLLHGSAYAKEGQPATRVRVAMNVGTMLKGLDVIGDRVWARPTMGFKIASKPLPFTVKPISYERAFGGCDVHPDDPGKVKSYSSNPVGVGYYPYARSKDLEGKLLPNTAELDVVPDSPKGSYKAMSFGPVGRNFRPRVGLAGTYDEQWLEEVFPFLPEDFDPAFFQSAPIDQQIPYPSGGELVVLRNLTPAGRTTFRLPRLEVPVEFTTRGPHRREVMAVLDTIMIEPDLGRLILTWRASEFLRHSLREVAQVVVGRMPQTWYTTRADSEKPPPPPSPVLELPPPAIEEPPPAAEEPSPPRRESEPPRVEPSRAPLPVEKQPPPLEPPSVEPPRVQAPITEPLEPPEPPCVVPKEPAVADDALIATQVWGAASDMVRQHTTPIVQIEDREEDELTATLVWESSSGLVATSEAPTTTVPADIDLTETMMEWPPIEELAKLDLTTDEPSRIELEEDDDSTVEESPASGEVDLMATMVEMPDELRKLLSGDMTDTVVDMPEHVKKLVQGAEGDGEEDEKSEESTDGEPDGEEA